MKGNKTFEDKIKELESNTEILEELNKLSEEYKKAIEYLNKIDKKGE